MTDTRATNEAVAPPPAPPSPPPAEVGTPVLADDTTGNQAPNLNAFFGLAPVEDPWVAHRRRVAEAEAAGQCPPAPPRFRPVLA